MSRQARLYIQYEEEDISADISSSILSFSYTDNASGKADEIQLRLEDVKGLWKGLLYPKKGSVIKVSIIVDNWDTNGYSESLPCGLFEIDEIQLSGPPDTVEIKAVSIPISSNLRGEKKTRAWETIRLSKIASEIAAKSGLKLIFDCDEDPVYDRVEQSKQNDLEFLFKLCNDAGLAIKVANKKLIIFDEEKYEAKNAVRKIIKGETDLLSYSFSTSSRDVYKSAEVNYHDPETGEKIKASFTPKNGPKVGQTLKINESSNFAKVKKSPKDAKATLAIKKAKKRLREKNKNEFKANLRLVGDIKLCAGSVVEIEGFGIFDGKYFIEMAVHNLDSSGGYITEIEIRKTLEGY
ncbi:MAG: hypothetical protein NC925_03095 [Candidatus Omnitrophica bacterium]|nr:hypothetical protein [Candidatus Omnitrophota bacterium]